MVRKKPTSRFRGTDMFTRRIVITVPRGGAFLVAVGVCAGLGADAKVGRALTMVAVIVSIVAVISIAEARHQLRNFRYEMHEAISTAVKEMMIPDADLRESVDDVFEEVDPRVTARFVRLSKRQNSSGRNKP
jgi:hypothetical protein